MAGKCEICGKIPMFGNRISHSNRHTRHMWLPNIQRKKMTLEGRTRHVNICTRCLRTQSKA